MAGQRNTRSRLFKVGLGLIAVGSVLGAAWSGGMSRLSLGISVPTARASEPRCPQEALAPSGIEVGSGVGHLAPDFTLPDLSGNPVSLSSFRGCPVILDFWASWCRPCQVSIPILESLRQRHAPRGVKVVAVSLDYRREDAVRFLYASGISEFIVLWAPFVEARAVARLFGVEAIPRTFLLDRQGVIRFIGHPQDLSDEVLSPWL